MSSALLGGFLTTAPPGKPLRPRVLAILLPLDKNNQTCHYGLTVPPKSDGGPNALVQWRLDQGEGAHEGINALRRDCRELALAPPPQHGRKVALCTPERGP